MLYTKLDGMNKQASRLVYGTPSSAGSGDLQQALKDYETAFELGFRIFDTAHAYGSGEKMLGEWLDRSGHRDQVIILDKGCNPGPNEPDVYCAQTILDQIGESLESLKTDHVELYILHRDDVTKPVDEIVEVLNDLKCQGKIVRFGGSNWTMARIQEVNAYAKAHGLEGFTVCSPNFTYARLITDPWGGSVTLTGEENAPFRQFLTENQMPVFNYSSLARGFLSGKYKSDSTEPIENILWEGTIWEYYAEENVERLAKVEQVARELGCTVPQVAMAWVLHQPMNLFPITTPTGRDHVEAVIQALHIKLTDAQLAYLG